MLKREFKINFKSFIIWTLIGISLFLVVFLVYPSIIESNNGNNLNQMLESFPKEMLAMFNMDISNVDTAYGWFKTEGLACITLLTCLYSAILGSSILVKEESDKTIEFLYSKPINRSQIVTSKLLCGTIYLIASLLIITIFNVFGMYFSDCLELKTFLLLSFSLLLTSLPMFYLTVFISTFFRKTKNTFGISLGIVFISYFLQLLSCMGKKLEFLKYISLHTLADSRGIIENGNVNVILLIIAITISVISIIGIYINYNRKELV